MMFCKEHLHALRHKFKHEKKDVKFNGAQEACHIRSNEALTQAREIEKMRSKAYIRPRERFDLGLKLYKIDPKGTCDNSANP